MNVYLHVQHINKCLELRCINSTGVLLKPHTWEKKVGVYFNTKSSNIRENCRARD